MSPGKQVGKPALGLHVRHFVSRILHVRLSGCSTKSLSYTLTKCALCVRTPFKHVHQANADEILSNLASQDWDFLMSARSVPLTLSTGAE